MPAGYAPGLRLVQESFLFAPADHGYRQGYSPHGKHPFLQPPAPVSPGDDFRHGIGLKGYEYRIFWQSWYGGAPEQLVFQFLQCVGVSKLCILEPCYSCWVNSCFNFIAVSLVMVLPL